MRSTVLAGYAGSNNSPERKFQFKLKPLACCTLAAMSMLQGQAYAQDEGAPEEVVVTGSRLRTTGMDLPSPVTVVTKDEIDIIAPTTLIEGLAELPQFYGSATTQQPSGFFTSTGAGSLNLRGLQSKRTLQLLDSRRVVSSTIFGGPDINLFPENVISSVETVTGGASAAYGTDAVAGVVNFILDTDYEGIRGNVQMGETSKGHNSNYEYSVGGGFSLGDRGHVLLNAEKSEQDPIFGPDMLEYGWYRSSGMLPNPDPNAGDSIDNPFYRVYDDVRSTGIDLDGIFYLPNNLGGKYILDSNGNATQWVDGDVCSSNGCSVTNGGSGHDNQTEAFLSITPESGRENYFGYADYDLTDNLNVYGQAIYGEAYFISQNFGGLMVRPALPFGHREFTIYNGNPWIPDAVQQIMDDNNLASVPFSRYGSIEDIAADSQTKQITETTSLTAGFNYDITDGFLDGWQVRGYYQKGETDVEAVQAGGIRLDRIYLAADVVLDSNNQPACNVTVTSGLYPDCVPINLFGRGNASPAAVDWVTGFEPGVQMNVDGFLSATESLPYSYVSSANKVRAITIDQDVWEISADGQISEGFGAGPINMAIGYGSREESFVQAVETGPGANVNADPRFRPVMANDASLGIRGVPGGAAASGNSVEFQFSNVPFARGSQKVDESFVEFLVPLVSDMNLVQQLNFSAAARWASYDGSGDVWSWKGGFDWALTDELRLRSTMSQDVRAATMGEKFDRTGGIGNGTDYLLDPSGGLSYGFTIFSNGSPGIQPEEAKTKTVGFVYQPDYLDGLSVSLDWYSVVVTDNINQAGAGAVLEGCYQDGDDELCSLITRGGLPSTEDPSINYISLVGVPYYNQNSVKAAGVDFEINYRTDVDWFGGGEFVNVRMLGSYLRERSNTTQAGSKTEIQGRFGSPEWTAVVSGGYNRGPLRINTTLRYTDKTIINPNWNFLGSSTRFDVADNTVNSEVLVDTRIGYGFELAAGTLNVYLNVNNLLDRDPQPFFTGAYSNFFSIGPGDGVTGDMRGRRYNIGANFEF